MIPHQPQVQNLSEHKQRVATVYNLASAGYDQPAVRFFSRCATRLVELAHIQPGSSILDVGTGTGAAALPAAQQAGPSGHVVGVDIAQEMLAQAQRKSAAAGLTTLEFLVADSEQLSFPENTFDVVLSAASLFFLPDMLAGLREWRRVTKPGGSVVIGGFGASAFQPLSDLFEARLRSYSVTFPTSIRPFSWQRLPDPKAYSTLLEEAGFEAIELHADQLGYFLQDAGEWWTIVWNSGFRGPVAQLSPEQMERFKTEHLAEVEILRTEQGIWLDINAVFALGRKPTEE